MSNRGGSDSIKTLRIWIRKHIISYLLHLSHIYYSNQRSMNRWYQRKESHLFFVNNRTISFHFIPLLIHPFFSIIFYYSIYEVMIEEEELYSHYHIRSFLSCQSCCHVILSYIRMKGIPLSLWYHINIPIKRKF